MQYRAKKFVVIADYRKDSSKLGEKWKKGIPVEVVPSAMPSVLRSLTAMGMYYVWIQPCLSHKLS